MGRAEGHHAAFWSAPPSRVGSRVEAVAGVAELIRRPLDDWQRDDVDCLTSYRVGGLWSHLEAVEIAPRQNGKTGGVVLPIVLAEALYGPPDLIIWSAHLYDTAQKSFADFVRLIDGTPELSRRVKKITSGTGEEAIEFRNGTLIDFLARSGKSGRGFSRGKIIVVDEALFFVAMQAGALLPVVAAHPNPLIIYASSAAKLESDYLRSLRDRGRPGGDPSLAYVEHCAPGSLAEPGCAAGPKCPHPLEDPGCSLNSEDLMRVANPSVGIRNRIDVVLSLRRSLEGDPVEFAREFLGWHEELDGATSRITSRHWAGAVDELSRIDGERRPVFVIDTAPDATWSSIAVAGGRADGATHVGLIRHAAGDAWVVDEALALRKKHGDDVLFGVDSTSPAASLLAKLEGDGVNVRRLSLSEVAQACGAFARDIRGVPPAVRHRGDPLVERALKAAAVRVVGDGAWIWTRKNSDGDITPLYAETLAAWLHTAEPESDPLDNIW